MKTILLALLWFFKVVKVGLENILTSYYEKTGLLKPVLSIRPLMGSKDDRN